MSGNNLLIDGATGSGKTWLACAFGYQACRKGLKVQFFRLSKFFEYMKLANADGTYNKKIAKLSKSDLLIFDDLAIDAIEANDRRVFLEVVETINDTKSIIATSQLPVDKWHDWLSKNNKTAADALMDRLTQRAHRINIKGPSLRTRNPEDD